MIARLRIALPGLAVAALAACSAGSGQGAGASTPAPSTPAPTVAGPSGVGASSTASGAGAGVYAHAGAGMLDAVTRRAKPLVYVPDLGSNRVDRNPYHVTYVVDPTEDNAQATAVADHAYWVSGLKTRKAGNGTVDAVSGAFGTTDPRVEPMEYGGGALVGGEIPAMAYVSRRQTWGQPGHLPKADKLHLDVTNLRTVTVDMARAGLSCGAQLVVRTDGPLDVVLGGCGRSVHYDRT